MIPVMYKLLKYTPRYDLLSKMSCDSGFKSFTDRFFAL